MFTGGFIMLKKNMKNIALVLTLMSLGTVVVPSSVAYADTVKNDETSKQDITTKLENQGELSGDDVAKLFNQQKSETTIQTNEIQDAELYDNFDPTINLVITPDEVKQAKTHLMYYDNFTAEELSTISDKEVVYLYQQSQNPETRMRGKTVAKLILKVWKKLPKAAKKKITKLTGLGNFLKVVDHYTGTEYHIIYSALRKVGMSKGWASMTTKTITLFI
ncbi:hypothetical protein IV87_GL001421 [Pediococcus ethanolidurans]|uniref:Uncharacterized protein n=2 Tax=Pediococcus ethanolidurans TaxID=319653 RepID=A0A0R2JW44_9LACO|nr:hypothetical protein IV87_GL001421 [Pediococcus ethanolidurans]